MFCHAPRLMVSPQQCDLLGVLKLQTSQEDKHLHRAEAAVHIISQEEQVAVRKASVNDFLEHVYHIKKLAMDVSNDNSW